MNDSLLAKTASALRHSLLPPAPKPPVRRKRSVSVSSALWTPGQTLSISFIGTTPESLKQAILVVAHEWLEHAYLKFELRNDNDAAADIRIQTDGPENLNKSALGNLSLRSDGASMSLSVKPSAPWFKRTVLHEFGHALGMHHEHQHPDANIPWNVEALVENIASEFSEDEQAHEDFNDLLFNQIATNYFPLQRDDLFTLPYDKESIMHYTIEQSVTFGDWALEESDKISEKDKQFMRIVYPAPPPVETT